MLQQADISFRVIVCCFMFMSSGFVDHAVTDSQHVDEYKSDLSGRSQKCPGEEILKVKATRPKNEYRVLNLFDLTCVRKQITRAIVEYLGKAATLIIFPSGFRYSDKKQKVHFKPSSPGGAGTGTSDADAVHGEGEESDEDDIVDEEQVDDGETSDPLPAVAAKGTVLQSSAQKHMARYSDIAALKKVIGDNMTDGAAVMFDVIFHYVDPPQTSSPKMPSLQGVLHHYRALP